ncbi:hypothetical protein JXR01_03735 [Candidatus Kaiserbacteria bacterium]|nr:MAG: hypothetical protein JXR01_03735 [Candidatus Kaiserbacteria bacterium]
MKKTLIIGGVIVALLVFGSWWSRAASTNDPNVISNNGVHWHPTLEIYVNDELQEIPSNLGLVGVHGPLHTHDDLPNIHLEFEGPVTREDTQLQRFFDVWGKDFNELGDSVSMTVNEETNTQFGMYEMRDGDKIVLRYE